MKYIGIERRLAAALEAFPNAKGIAKSAYQRLNYLIYGQRNFASWVAPGATILDASDWCGHSDGVRSSEFFGYYDKCPWDPSGQKLLVHRLSENGEIGIFSYSRTVQGVHKIGETTAWNFQQGSMSQWLNWQGALAVIFNKVIAGKLVSAIVTPEGVPQAEIPAPIQVVHPQGKEALTLNYRRLARLRPEYGYQVQVENFTNLSDDADGVWRIDLIEGTCDILHSLAELRANNPRSNMDGAQHKVNHILYSPAGERFCFLHRWLGPKGKFSRLYVRDSKSLRLLLDDRMVSHFCWRDEEHLLVWARTRDAGDKYYLINVITGEKEVIGAGILDPFGDGHPSYSPDREWILTDTYPDRARVRHLLLIQPKTGRLLPVGRFLAPLKFDRERRCDLHPRWSPDGKSICIDSAHTGQRRVYVIQLNDLLRSANG